MDKVKNRSSVRIFLGGIFFSIQKNLYWFFSGNKFAKELRESAVGKQVFRHESFLLRPLKNVEMWMQYNKIKNLQIAIKKLDGLVIKPGEVFSYWMLIGKPTKSKGYLPGMVLHRGGFKSGIGGGLCQLSNLIYWMTLHTPLTVIERWRHSYDVFPDVQRTQPFGSGATCSYPNIDLQIKNETNNVFQLRLRLTDTHLVGQWLCDKPLNVSFEIEERHHFIHHEWWGGYTRNNEIVKITKDLLSGKKLHEETVAQNHAIMMYDPLIQASNQDNLKESHKNGSSM